MCQSISWQWHMCFLLALVSKLATLNDLKRRYLFGMKYLLVRLLRYAVILSHLMNVFTIFMLDLIIYKCTRQLAAL